MDERLVADQVNLRLPAKGLVVLTGERGSGKTALLRCLAGFDLRGQADVGGAITLEGRPAARDELRSVAAYVSEQAPPLSDSVRDNLVSGIADWRELGYAQCVAKVRRHLLRLGFARIAGAFESPLIAMPLFAQTQIAIARALLRDPRLLLVDGIADYVEDDELRQLVELLDREASCRAVLLATRHVHVAAAMGGTRFSIAEGRVIAAQPVRTREPTAQLTGTCDGR
ncbi:MAG: ATP-binding cassette domain-containing protein [Myxococcales bacterium]|nr:ATP-binding cassette domain-containing protein [Myxococcales bacterium]